MESKILAKIEKNRQPLIELLQKLVRIPSLTGEEGAAQSFLADYLRGLGLEVVTWEPDVREIFEKFPQSAQYPTHWEHDLILPYDRLPTYEAWVVSGKTDILTWKNRPNVLATLKGSGGGRTLLLNGHVDTVTIAPREDWSHDPFGAEIVDGKLFGRGACDMKGGLAAALGAVRCLIDAGVSLRGDVIFSSVVNEEHSGGGALSMICRGITADAAIVTEPSENRVCIAHPGDVYWQVTVEGVPRSPGARWEGDRQVGISAVEKLPPVIDSLMRLEAEFNTKSPHPLYENTRPFSCVIGEVHGGSYATVTASRCVLRGCVYFSPGLGSVTDIMDSIRATVTKAVQDDPWFRDHPVRVEFLRHKNTAVTDRNESIVRVVTDTARTLRSTPVSVSGATYGADMELFVNLAKIPTVILGPGSIAQAHKPDEFVPIDEYIEYIKLLALNSYRWCK
ncbi:MAG: ArgE/DapE family deacylase [Deltaproteobacteria bacterium]|nr:ArgE/DapE family deacylase [Deltaproteobacteria bacterium]